MPRSETGAGFLKDLVFARTVNRTRVQGPVRYPLGYCFTLRCGIYTPCILLRRYGTYNSLSARERCRNGGGETRQETERKRPRSTKLSLQVSIGSPARVILCTVTVSQQLILSITILLQYPSVALSIIVLLGAVTCSVFQIS